MNKRTFLVSIWANLNLLLGLTTPLGTNSLALKSYSTLIIIPTAGPPTVYCNGLAISVVFNKH